MKKIYGILEKIYNNKELRKSIVPAFLGTYGIGKTSIIKQFAEDHNANVVEIIASQINPLEVSGMAMPVENAEEMKYFNYDRLKNLKDGDILFFDELLNGQIPVLNACLTLIESRQLISGQKLPEIMIVAAANEEGACYLTPQIKQRFMWYKINLDWYTFKKYMKYKYLIPNKTISAILDESKKIYDKEDKESYNLVSPRNIEKIINSCIFNLDIPEEFKSIATILKTFKEIYNLEKEMVLPNKTIIKNGDKYNWLKLKRLEYGIVKE